jgi:hypothetical protein
MSVVKLKTWILLTTWCSHILEYNYWCNTVYLTCGLHTSKHCIWLMRCSEFMSMSFIRHCTTYLALSWQTRPPSGRSEWPVTRTAAITTPAVAPVIPPLMTPLLDLRGLNLQLPPAVRSMELLKRLIRVLVSCTSVSYGNFLGVNVLSSCFNRQGTKTYARVKWPKTK